MKKLIVLVLALATIIGVIFAVNVSAAAEATLVSNADIAKLYEQSGAEVVGGGMNGGSYLYHIFDGNKNLDRFDEGGGAHFNNTAGRYIVVDLTKALEGGYFVTEIQIAHVGNTKYSLYISNDGGNTWEVVTVQMQQARGISTYTVNKFATQVKYVYDTAISWQASLSEIEVYGIDPAELSCAHENLTEEGWVVVPNSATCTDTGDMVQVCPDCEESIYNIGVVPPLGHNYVINVGTPGTSISYGSGTISCDRCKNVSFDFAGEVDLIDPMYGGLKDGTVKFTNVTVSSADTYGPANKLFDGVWDGYYGNWWFAATNTDEDEYALYTFETEMDLTKLDISVLNDKNSTLVISALNSETGEFEEVRRVSGYDSNITSGNYRMTISLLGVTTSALKLQVFSTTDNGRWPLYWKMVICEAHPYGIVPGCGLNADNHECVFDTFVDYVNAPTCQTAGTATYKCICNNTEVRDVEASEEFHKFVEVEGTRVDATCVAAGSYTGDCEYCDATTTITIEIDAENGHAWTETSKTDADCVNAGAINYDCDNCEATKTEEIAAKGHTYGEAVVVPSTCKDNGTSTKTCTVCGNEDVTTLETTGCTWTIDSYITEPTCVEAGEANYVCSVCGETKVDTVSATGNHTWDRENAVITTQPTCEGTGWKALTCTVCNGTSRENIPALGHNVTVESARTEPTCVAKGSVTYVCANGCGRSSTTEIPATGVHNYATEIEKVPATRTEAGYIIYGCTTCEATYTETLPKLEATIYHVSTWDEFVKAVDGGANASNPTNTYVTVNGETVYIQDGDIIRLDADITGNASIYVRKNITIDLAGYTLRTKGTSGSQLMMMNGSLISSTVQKGTLVHEGVNNVLRIYGNVTEIRNVIILSDNANTNKAAGISVLVSGNANFGTGYVANISDVIIANADGRTSLKVGFELVGTVATISNVTVNNAGEAALWMNGGTCNSISDSTFNGTVGVLFAKTSSATLTNCTVTGTEAAVKVKRDKDTTTKITVNFTANNTTLTATNGIVVINEDTEKATVATFAVPGFKAEGDKVVCDGEHNYVAVVVDPTCEADGYTRHTCANCGAYYDDTVVAALGHDYEQTGRVEPALGVDGYIEYTCNNCGGKKQDPLCAHDLKVVDSKDATCGAAGYKSYDCTKCDYAYTETIDALKHNYTETRVEPESTTVPGSVTFTCTNCGDSSTYDIKLFEFNDGASFHTAYVAANEYDIIRMTGNALIGQLSAENKASSSNYINKRITIDLNGFVLTTTSTWSGILIDGYASMVNGTIIHVGKSSAFKTFAVDRLEDLTIIVYGYYNRNDIGGISIRGGDNAHINTIKNVKILGAGNYGIESVSKGLKDRNIIDLMENVYIDSMGYGIDFDTGLSIGTIKNCVISGSNYGIGIGNSGDYPVKMNFVGENTIMGGINAMYINYSSTGTGYVNITTSAGTNFISNGTTISLNVNTTEKSTISLVGYTINGNTVTECQHNKVLGNCTTETYCSTCGKTFGHEHGEMILNAEKSVAATCTTLGNAYYNCEACGAEKMELVARDANAHVIEASYDYKNDLQSDNDRNVYVAPTCTTDGSQEYKCIFGYCNTMVNTVEIRVIPALGHTAGTPVVENNVDPDCDTAGSYDSVVYCTVCNAEISRTPVTVNALGHNLVAGKVVDPSCEAAGYTVYNCSRCDYTENKDATEATGHNYEITEKVEAKPGEAGYIKETCTNCGDVKTTEIEALPEHTHTEVSFVKELPLPSNNHTAKVGKKCTECGEITVDPVAVVAEQHSSTDAFRLRAVTLQLEENISINYKPGKVAGYENVYMVFVFNGKEYVVLENEGIESATASTGEKYDRYVFNFAETTPDLIQCNIEAYVYAETEDGYAMNSYLEYSVLTYCINQLKKNNAKLTTLVSDLLVMCEMTQLYVGKLTDSLVTDLIPSDCPFKPSTFTSIDPSLKIAKVTGDRDSGTDWKTATLQMGSSTEVNFRFETDNLEGLQIKVTVAGKTEYYDAKKLTKDGNRYVVNVKFVFATEYDKPITATFLRDGKQVGSTMNYSVSSYLASNYDKSGLKAYTTDLIKALYLYGQSTKAYFNK